MKYFNETYLKRKFITRNEWADTYKAIHAITEEKVILKVLARKSEDEEYINKLLKEVELLKSIKNPNLININNMLKYSGCGKTYYYIEGEYFIGIPLEEKIAGGKFEEKEAVKIVETLAEGLKEFHNRNIVFENLNLGNIFINSKDVVKVDVLSHLENKNFITLSNNETEDKIEKNIFNCEKDIYDLAVILYSLLTGKTTFELNNYKKQISDENLVSIIEKATNNNLESKYHNINRFILDLKSYLQYGKLSDKSYNVKEKSNKRKKGKIGKTLSVCTAIAVIGSATVYGYDLLQKNNTETTKIEEIVKTDEEDKKVEESKEDKIDVENTNTSTDTDNQTIEKSTSHSLSDSTKNKNTSKNDSNKSNNLSNNSSNKDNSDKSNKNDDDDNDNKTNKPNKPNKPNNNENSGNTTTKPEKENDDDNQTPEVTPPSNDNSEESKNTTPEEPGTQVESE